MNKRHEQMIENAMRAIDDVFSDASVSKEQTLDDLKHLRSEIEIKIETLIH